MEFDATFWVGAAFVVFVGILFIFKVPYMLINSLDQRANKIRDEINEARQLREEAQTLLANYERKQRDSINEANQILEQAKKEGERARKLALEKLKETLKRREEIALEKIALAEVQAEKEVREAAVEIAINATRILLSEHVEGKRGAALIDAGTAQLKGSFS